MGSTGLQVLAGDVAAASESHAAFFWVWQQFGALPERFLYAQGLAHPTEKYYPLRPELFESTFYLHQVGPAMSPFMSRQPRQHHSAFIGTEAMPRSYRSHSSWSAHSCTPAPARPCRAESGLALLHT